MLPAFRRIPELAKLIRDGPASQTVPTLIARAQNIEISDHRQGRLGGISEASYVEGQSAPIEYRRAYNMFDLLLDWRPIWCVVGSMSSSRRASGID
jgi:hypothetical protein